MSGKGKLKGKSRPVERKTKFDEGHIDAVCLAYDIFKYSASKFGVDDNCLAVWEGPKNDYGPRVHFEYICRPVIVNQLKFRYICYLLIKNSPKNDELESYEFLCQVLEESIELLVSNLKPTEIELVEVSLAFVCELILYLYAKGKCLYIKQLAEHWFECYFRKAKKQFEKEGGFGAVCWRGYLNVCDYPDFFIDLCIKNYKYNDYEKSVQNEKSVNKFLESSRNYIKKNQKYDCPKPSFKLGSKVADINFPHVSTPEPEKAPENSFTPHPALGVPTPEELHGSLLAGGAVQSQNLPEEDLSKSTKRLSYLDRKRTKKASSRSRVEQCHGQLSSNSSTCTDTTQCYERHGTKPKVPVQNTASSGLQLNKSIPSSRVGQGHGQLSLNSSIATDVGPTYERHETKPKVPVQNTGSSGLQIYESSLCSKVEQGIGQLSFDSSRTKLLREKKTIPSIAKYLMYSTPDEIRQERTRRDKGSSSDEET